MRSIKSNLFYRNMITTSQVAQWRNRFQQNSNKKKFQNLISDNKLSSLYTNRDQYQKHQHIFSHRVKPYLKVTAQKASGRCWLFAALNVIRRDMVKKYDIENFEFSQSYLFFWDKLERINYGLSSIIKTKDYQLDSQLVQHLLTEPTCDGGQWDMVVNLVEKYGLVPKSVFRETHHSSNSREMNIILTKKFREYAMQLRQSEDPESLKDQFMEEVYGMLCQFLGTPPKTFDFEYLSKKDDQYHLVENLTPLKFYQEYVDFNCEDYACVIHDPRTEHPYHQMYTVQFLGNVEGGHKVRYLNLPIEELQELVKQNIQDDQVVWFGCDVGKWLHQEECSMDLNLVDYSFLTNFNLNKEERLKYRDSLMTHAMVFTGANIRGDQVDKWQVENSWATRDAAEGYYIMTNDWFNEYVYEVVVHKKYLEKYKSLLEGDQYVELKPWDPMGSLAK